MISQTFDQRDMASTSSSSSLMSEYLFSMDTKNRSKNLDVKYLHPFSPSPSHNGHRHNPGAEGKPSKDLDLPMRLSGLLDPKSRFLGSELSNHVSYDFKIH